MHSHAAGEFSNLINMKNISIVILAILLTVSCQARSDIQGHHTQLFSHETFDALLKKHVNEEGMVDYEGFIRDQDQLESYLKVVSANPPDPESWTEEEQIAYWINAYNAFTIKLIADHYPVESIQDLQPVVNTSGVNTVWHKKFFKIGGQESSLDEIEHKILREQFKEPRIHFAINCASFSCPPLRNEAFTAEKLDQQLDEQAVRFINDPQRNVIQKDEINISPIFSWFSKDFTRDGSLIDFINQYAKVQVSPEAKVSYLDYNWSLNKQELSSN